MGRSELATYINDHLAGSVAALELLDYLIAHPLQPDDVAFFNQLRDEITGDQDVVRTLLRQLGSGESTVRKAAGWLAEKVAGLKFRWDDSGDHALRRFEALEALALGVLGKLSLWRVLAELAPGEPALQRLDFARLGQQAEKQHAGVEARRVAAAGVAFGPA